MWQWLTSYMSSLGVSWMASLILTGSSLAHWAIPPALGFPYCISTVDCTLLRDEQKKQQNQSAVWVQQLQLTPNPSILYELMASGTWTAITLLRGDIILRTASRAGHFQSESWCSKTALAAKGRTRREPLVTWKVHDGGLESFDSWVVILRKNYPGVKMARN